MLAYNFSETPHVGMTGKVRERVGWSHSGRTMRFNLLVVIQDGECVFRIDGKDYAYQKGDVALVPMNTFYQPHTDTFTEYTFFHFDGNFQKVNGIPPEFSPIQESRGKKSLYGAVEFDDRILYFDNKMSLGNQARNIELLISKCVSTRYNADPKLQLLLSLQFSELMFYLSLSYSENYREKNSVPVSVNKILYYIKENYTHSISLEDICKSTKLSKQYCMRVFKKYLHTTINDYILDLRMRHAAYLLNSTYMNVNQTADYLGFSSVSYFSRVFKKYYGVPPSDYFE